MNEIQETNGSGMNAEQFLVVMKAINMASGEIVNGKNPTSLCSMVAEEYGKRYDELLELAEKYNLKDKPKKTFSVEMDGKVIGTIIPRFSEAKDERAEYFLELDDYEKLAQWYEGLTYQELDKYLSANLFTVAQWFFNDPDYGEVPPGCTVKKIIRPAQPREFLGIMVKPDRENVYEAVKGFNSGSVIAGLLGGAE